MKHVFADSSYWIALLHPADALHQKARDVSAELGSDVQFHTSEMVLGEVLTVLREHRELRSALCEWEKSIRELDTTTVMPQDSRIFRKAVSLFCSRGDKEWSITDCSSIAYMNEKGITEVLSYDYHFVQAGLNALLR